MDLTTDLLASALTAAGLRQRVLASDIANVDTPGFAAKDVSFTAQLQAALQNGTNPRSVRPVVVTEPGVYGNNQNGVDPDKTMALLAENAIRYSVLSRALMERFQDIQTAIKGS